MSSPEATKPDMVLPHDHKPELPSSAEATNAITPRTPSTHRHWRFASDIFLLICIICMLLWPWVFFGVVKARNGVQMSNELSEKVARHPHQVGAIVTFIGTINRLIATLLFGKAVVRLGQEIIATNSSQDSPQATVFGISALLAFRHMTLVWGVRQWKNLVQGFSRLAVVALLLASLAALALIPSGTANLITPVEFNKTADLRGTELDFTSADPECIAFLGRSQLTNLCDWKTYHNTQFTTCLGENQIMDVLDSGRANMLSVIGIHNETSSLNQLSAEGGIKFLGSARGVLPIGPDGVPAFNSLETSSNPFTDPDIRRGMVSHNYTLTQQGLETNVSCSYDPTSPIAFEGIENSTMVIATYGSCDAAMGVEPVTNEVLFYPTVNGNNTLTYWTCKELQAPGSIDPTYFIYLRGRVNYRTSIGNITCRVSPMRSREFNVDYHSSPGYFSSRATNTSGALSERSTYPPFTDWILVAFGNLMWETQNWASHLVAEAVFSMGTKNLNVSSFEPSDTHLRLFEAMIQGILEYGATYSRLVYSIGDNPPQTCSRAVTGHVSYSVRGWFIDNPASQVGLLIPGLLINASSLLLLLACFIIGQFRYTYDLDVTDSMSLLTAFVVDRAGVKSDTKEWGNKVKYDPKSGV
ncbi:hypothetical protein MD484_g7634, partial [Candolleomyces efflorescens]